MKKFLCAFILILTTACTTYAGGEKVFRFEDFELKRDIIQSAKNAENFLLKKHPIGSDYKALIDTLIEAGAVLVDKYPTQNVITREDLSQYSVIGSLHLPEDHPLKILRNELIAKYQRQKDVDPVGTVRYGDSASESDIHLINKHIKNIRVYKYYHTKWIIEPHYWWVTVEQDDTGKLFTIKIQYEKRAW